jgi:hypothetical protein
VYDRLSPKREEIPTKSSLYSKARHRSLEKPIETHVENVLELDATLTSDTTPLGLRVRSDIVLDDLNGNRQRVEWRKVVEHEVSALIVLDGVVPERCKVSDSPRGRWYLGLLTNG